MKEKEKLDLILRAFYQYRNEVNPVSIQKLCSDNKIPIENRQEQNRLVKELDTHGYIKLFGNTAAAAIITSNGVQYCEEDSFGNPGYAIVYNISTINGSDNILIVNSSGISVNKNAATEILNKILKAIEKDNEVSNTQKEAIMTQLKEVQNAINAKGDPSNSLLRLLAVGANVASIGSFLFDLLGTIDKL